MSAGGHILDMVKRLRNNRIMRSKTKFKGNNRDSIHSFEKVEKAKPYRRKIPANKFKSIVTNIEKKAFKHNRRKVVVLSIYTGLALLLLILMVWGVD